MANPTLRTFLNGRFTRKQVYEFVLASIIEQGKPGSEQTSWGNSVCVYRGDDGVKCGVGHLVTDSDLKKAIKFSGGVNSKSSVNNLDINSLIYDLDLLDKSDKEDVNFLESMQATHDDAESMVIHKKHKRGSASFNRAFISEFKRGMKTLKKEYNIKD